MGTAIKHVQNNRGVMTSIISTLARRPGVSTQCLGPHTRDTQTVFVVYPYQISYSCSAQGFSVQSLHNIVGLPSVLLRRGGLMSWGSPTKEWPHREQYQML